MKKWMILSSIIALLTSCLPTVRETPDLINLTGGHVHKEELDMMFGLPTSSIGDDRKRVCVYKYSGLVLDTREGKKDLGEGEFIIRAHYGSDHLINYTISPK